jgi:sterol desaturase/sphingolipid hydroxylase (fatty acid hydroxylase superfamily)
VIVVGVVVALALAMLGAERAWPRRRWPHVPTWWARALAINGAQIALVFVAGATWERWLRGPHLLALARHGRGPEIALGYAVNVMWMYWAHRARHRFAVLWRWLHQLHHSPARIEVLTAYYKHPLEITSESIATSVLLYAVLGVSPEAALVITTTSGVLGLFYHWNVATPRWLGYLVQRPESHCIHHEHGVHAFNYSELPIIDIVFGTFRNPLRFVGQCGLGADREQRFAALLLGEDVVTMARRPPDPGAPRA